MVPAKAGYIHFEKVSKNYGKVKALKELIIKIEAGERLVLLGPSGCGKTTALRIIAGLERITSGQLFLDGRLANHLEPGERNVAMVFQNYALYPHMTVWENIAFGLQVRRLPKAEINKRVKEALAMLDLQGLEQRKPRELSGGQRQRVALARAVVKQAPYFLLDEPLSNLDAQLRAHARSELVRLHQKVGSTMVYVTHDQTEAMTIGQRIAVLANGVLQQVDTPENIYHRPANTFVAKFIGNPPMNLLAATIKGNQLYIGENIKLVLPNAWSALLLSKSQGKVIMGLRPEDVVLNEQKGPDSRSFRVRVTWKENYGSQKLFYLDANGKEIIASLSGNQSLPSTEGLWVVINWEKVHFFEGDSGISLGYPWNKESIPLRAHA